MNKNNSSSFTKLQLPEQGGEDGKQDWLWASSSLSLFLLVPYPLQQFPQLHAREWWTVRMIIEYEISIIEHTAYLGDKVKKKEYNLSHSSFDGIRRRLQVVEESKQDGLLNQKKSVPFSFLVNEARKFAQHQSHKTEWYNPTKYRDNTFFIISNRKDES